MWTLKPLEIFTIRTKIHLIICTLGHCGLSTLARLYWGFTPNTQSTKLFYFTISLIFIDKRLSRVTINAQLKSVLGYRNRRCGVCSTTRTERTQVEMWKKKFSKKRTTMGIAATIKNSFFFPFASCLHSRGGQREQNNTQCARCCKFTLAQQQHNCRVDWHGSETEDVLRWNTPSMRTGKKRKQ